VRRCGWSDGGLWLSVGSGRAGSAWHRGGTRRVNTLMRKGREMRVGEVALSAWMGVVGIAIGGWNRLAELAEEGVSVTPAQGTHAPVQGRAWGSSWRGLDAWPRAGGACKGAVGPTGLERSRLSRGELDISGSPTWVAHHEQPAPAASAGPGLSGEQAWPLRSPAGACCDHARAPRIHTGSAALDCHLTVTASGGESARVRLTSPRSVPPAGMHPSARPPRPRRRASGARSGRG
jgi:hypothetical protein